MTPITIAAILGILLGLAAGALLWRGRGSWDRADRAGAAAPARCKEVPGCCSNCAGTGKDAAAAETGGHCWDCRGTGHCHETEASS